MRIEIIPGSEAGSYDLLVDGTLKVACESMQVCDNIREALLRPMPPSECTEVADVIRKGLSRAIWVGGTPA